MPFCRKFIIIKSRGYGIFSNFLHTLQYLYLSEVENRIPIIYWDVMWYAQKEAYNGSKGNVWEYYFKPVSFYSINDIDREKDDIKEVHEYHENGVAEEPKGCWDYTKFYPEVCLSNPNKECRDFVNKIISKYVIIKSPIMRKIEKFYNAHMKGVKILGVHIRACNDKKGGQRSILWEEYNKSISQYLSKYDNAKIFLATDYAPCLKNVVKRFGKKIIYYSCKRSENGFPIPCNCQPSTKKQPGGPLCGEEALIDSVLLSKCDKLVHSTSNLSSVAMYFNPDIRHKYIPAK